MSGLTVDLEHRLGSLQLRASFEAVLASDGDRLALFGPSGSGKSTLLRILAGLVVPHRGIVSFRGKVLTDTAHGLRLPPGARGIGFVTQAPALFPHLSVAANLRFGIRGLSEREQTARVEELCALFSLHALLRREPAHLSGGERQRVALARALVTGPALLLLDEPFNALDAEARAGLWNALDGYLRARGTAMLLVSHDAGEVWAHADTVIRMENGTATQHGSPAVMLRRERALALEQLRER